MTSYDGYTTILVEKPEPRLGILWFNRPEKRNSISPDLSREMNDVLPKIDADDDIRVLIVSGKGSAFCAGMDLKVFYEYRDKPPAYSKPGESSQDWWRRLRELSKPTIAAVNGHAYGGGFMAISCCDLAVMAEDAHAGLSEINFGSPPGGGATRAASQMLLPKHSNYVLMAGLPVSGVDMASMGFVNRAVPQARLMEETLDLARVIAKHHPIALKWLKKQIHGSESILDFYLGIDYESMVLAQMRQSDNYTGHYDGWKGFIEKEYKPGLEAKDYA